jgi:porphobilinogen synthase
MVHISTHMKNLQRRPRRLRANASVRDLVAEVSLRPEDLLYPIFVTEDPLVTEPQPIPSLPGQFRLPLAALPSRVRNLAALGLRAIMLFPVNNPSRKDPLGSYAVDPKGLAALAIDTIKQAVPNMLVFADVALDPYTDHGHDGLIDSKGDVLNDETVEALVLQSLVLAKAGADFVCPSDMMDGRIGAIRLALDAEGHQKTSILSYCAKFASAFYGPFRDAVGQKIRGLDKATYQLSPATRRQAIIEAELDTAEGADILMVKPAGPYLDILRDLREQSHLPLAAYQVSGEYSMIKAAAAQGWINETAAVFESLVGCKRAGADLIATYFAEQVLENLSKT